MPLYYSERDTQTNVINVKQYGALGNGTTDDTSTIQAAINYASGITSFGGSVYFPAGTYSITSLTIPSYVKLHGATRDSSILLYSGTGIALQKNNSGITHGVEISDLTIKGTDGSGGTGLKIDSFRRGVFRNLTIDMFRNAGNTGVGLLFDNAFENCSFNYFENLEIANCDDALVMDGSNASYSCGYNEFVGTRILTEIRGLRLLNSVPDASKYNSFHGLVFQNAGTTTHCLEIEGAGNHFTGVVIDGSPTTTVLSFVKTNTAGNRVEMLTGWDASKYTNNYVSGVPNTVDTESTLVYSPGKPFIFQDIIGAADFDFRSAGTNQPLEIHLGNSSNTRQYTLTQQAAASPYLQVSNSSAVLQRYDQSSNIGFFGTTSAGGGTKVIFIGSATAIPSSNPSAGSLLYSSGGNLITRSSGGIVSTIGNIYSTAANLDTTPDVNTLSSIFVAYSSGTSITNFDNGVNAQQLTVVLPNGNTTISNNANIKLDNSLNFTPPSGGTLSLINYSGVWYETARATF